MNPNGKFSFLIAEDEPRIRKNLIKKICLHDSRFFLLHEVINGEQALECIKKEQPDILFSDIRMPVMDGLKLIEEVYYNFPDILIIIISGYNDFNYAQKAIQFGVLDYLLKPVENNNLAKTLEKITLRLESQKQEMDTETFTSHLAQETLASAVADYIREHYTEDISISSLAGKFYVNPTYMTRIFKKIMNKTPTRFILDLRINLAKKIIKTQPELELKEIAYMTGYTDQGYFSRIFKKTTGLSPSEYKEGFSSL